MSGFISCTGYTGAIGGLAITNNLSIGGTISFNRSSVEYQVGGSQGVTGATNGIIVQFPSIVSLNNATGNIGVTGANNTTFVNTSGRTQTWITTLSLAGVNNDPTNFERFVTRIVQNVNTGGSILIGNSQWVPANTSGGANTITTVSLMNPLDNIQANYFYSATGSSNTTIQAGGIIQISQI